MDQNAADLQKFMADAHIYTYQMVQYLQAQISNCADLKELADYGYALNKAHKLADDLKKEIGRALESAQRLQCALQTSISDVSSVHTDYCTATPKINFQMNVPKREKDPDTYYAIMRALGVPDSAADAEAVRPHWPGLTEWLTERMQRGEPLPEGIDPDNVKPVYSVTYRKKPNAPF